MNLSNTIIPKSDQLNADDLISGPRTIKIVAVEGGSAEQPVTIKYDGDNGRPYKPSKSMRRVLVSLWGADGNAYVGRRLTLFRNPLVKFAGEAVGGIQISHASDIPEAVQIALTETRGKRKPFRVEPLASESELLAAGEAAAKLGTDGLRAWWAKLNAEDQRLMKPHVEALKAKTGGAS